MLAHLTRLLQGRDRSLVCVEHHCCLSPLFLFLHFVDEWQKERRVEGPVVMFISVHTSLQALRVVASKVALRTGLDAKHFHFVNVHSFMGEEGGDGIKQLTNWIRQAMIEDKPSLLILDDIHVLSLLSGEDVERNAQPYVEVRRLKELLSIFHTSSSLVMGYAGHCPVPLASLFPLRIGLKPISSGLERTRTGVMAIEHEEPFAATIKGNQKGTTMMHYALGDRSVKLFLPGSDIPLT